MPLALGTLLAALCGCSQAASQPRSTVPAPAPVSPASARSPSGWAFVEGAGLRVRVPFAKEWQRRESPTSLRLEHLATQTKLVVRHWPTSRLVTVEQCQSELALFEPDAALAQRIWSRAASTDPNDASDAVTQNVVVEKSFEPGRDFRGKVRAVVLPAEKDTTTRGIVVAVAAGVGRCIALIADTSVTDTRAEVQLADRLAWLVEGVAPSLKLQTIEDRTTAKP